MNYKALVDRARADGDETRANRYLAEWAIYRYVSGGRKTPMLENKPDIMDRLMDETIRAMLAARLQYEIHEQRRKTQ